MVDRLQWCVRYYARVREVLFVFYTVYLGSAFFSEFCTHLQIQYMPDLPQEIISRILYHLHCQTNSIKELLSFLYTSKSNYDCRHLLYTFSPVTLINHPKRIGRQMNLLELVRFLSSNTTTYIQVLNVSYKLKYKTDFIEQFQRTHFRNLKSLTVETDTITVFKILNACPSIIKLSIIFSNFHIPNFKEIRAVSIPICNLEYLAFSSSEPLLQSKLHSMFYLTLTQDATFTEQYFKLRAVRMFERLTTNRRFEIGYLLYQLVDKNRGTLKLLELERVDFALIFNSRYTKAGVHNFLFPELSLLLIDTTSSLYIYTWESKFQEGSLLNSPMLAMNSPISGYLYIRKENEWKLLRNPQSSISSIKKRLGLLF